MIYGDAIWDGERIWIRGFNSVFYTVHDVEWRDLREFESYRWVVFDGKLTCTE